VVPRFVLASGSPRRCQLLKKAGYEFEIIRPPDDEVSHDCLTIRELTAWNAARKALRIAQTLPDAVVLAADTLVTIEDRVLGKPNDIEDAVRILRLLRGRGHEVWTAVSIRHAGRGKAHDFQEISRVHFCELSDRAIREYLAKVNPLDKAGAYAAQGHGTEIIERIEGSYSNVVGLPMEETARALRAFGVTPLRRRSQ
jgi:septum formation protein